MKSLVSIIAFFIASLSFAKLSTLESTSLKKKVQFKRVLSEDGLAVYTHTQEGLAVCGWLEPGAFLQVTKASTKYLQVLVASPAPESCNFLEGLYIENQESLLGSSVFAEN